VRGRWSGNGRRTGWILPPSSLAAGRNGLGRRLRLAGARRLKLERELPGVALGGTTELHPLQPRDDLLQLGVLQFAELKSATQIREHVGEMLRQRQQRGRFSGPSLVVAIHARTILRIASRAIQKNTALPIDFCRCGDHTAVGCAGAGSSTARRQSIPSISIDSCAFDSRTTPSSVVGQTKRPFSSRLA
jgi:hypothetical protein